MTTTIGYHICMRTMILGLLLTTTLVSAEDSPLVALAKRTNRTVSKKPVITNATLSGSAGKGRVSMSSGEAVPLPSIAAAPARAQSAAAVAAAAATPATPQAPATAAPAATTPATPAPAVSAYGASTVRNIDPQSSARAIAPASTGRTIEAASTSRTIEATNAGRIDPQSTARNIQPQAVPAQPPQ